MSLKTRPVRLVQAANAILGEGPLWVAQEQALYWIDIARPAIYRHDPEAGQTGMWLLPESVGCIAELASGGLLAALRGGLFRLQLPQGRLERLGSFAQLSERHRFNDGAVDPRGRFWVGAMSEGAQPGGALYRFDTAQHAQATGDGWLCPNGIGWSPQGDTMYVTDSARRTIWAFEYDLRSGQAGARRAFATFEVGTPDGLAVDAEGYVWVALWDGWSVARLDPRGALAASIDMPVQRPTSVAFGGRNLRTLFVTSASINLDPLALRVGPLAGALFAIETGVPGLPVARAALGTEVAMQDDPAHTEP